MRPSRPVAGFPDPIEARSETEESGSTRNSFRPRRSSRWFGRPACRRSRTCRNWRRTSCARCARRKTASPAPETRRRSLLEKLAAFGITPSRRRGCSRAGRRRSAPAPVTPLQRPHALAPADPGRVQPRPQPARLPGAPEPHGRAHSSPSSLRGRSPRHPGFFASPAELILVISKPRPLRPGSVGGRHLCIQLTLGKFLKR